MANWTHKITGRRMHPNKFLNIVTIEYTNDETDEKIVDEPYGDTIDIRDQVRARLSVLAARDAFATQIDALIGQTLDLTPTAEEKALAAAEEAAGKILALQRQTNLVALKVLKDTDPVYTDALQAAKDTLK